MLLLAPCQGLLSRKKAGNLHLFCENIASSLRLISENRWSLGVLFTRWLVELAHCNCVFEHFNLFTSKKDLFDRTCNHGGRCGMTNSRPFYCSVPASVHFPGASELWTAISWTLQLRSFKLTVKLSCPRRITKSESSAIRRDSFITISFESSCFDRFSKPSKGNSRVSWGMPELFFFGSCCLMARVVLRCCVFLEKP